MKLGHGTVIGITVVIEPYCSVILVMPLATAVIVPFCTEAMDELADATANFEELVISI